MQDIEKLSSFSSSTVQDFRSAVAGRSRADVLVEGVHHVMDSLTFSGLCRSALVSEALLDRPGGEELLKALQSLRAPFRLYRVGDSLMNRISPVERAQGVMLLLKRPYWSREELLGGLGAGDLVVVLPGVQDPGNVGTLFRSARASGAKGVLVFPGTADPLGPKALRSSAGTALGLPFLKVPSVEEGVRWLEEAGVALLGTRAGEGVDYRRYPFNEAVALVLGGEGAGLPPEMGGLVKEWLTIPIAPHMDSLNVAVAGSLLMFEAARRREGM